MQTPNRNAIQVGGPKNHGAMTSTQVLIVGMTGRAAISHGSCGAVFAGDQNTTFQSRFMLTTVMP
jgi:hypothetical protein